MALTELFGTRSCPYTREMREWLELRRIDYVEYDVEQDVAARTRMREVAGPERTVPLLVEGGRVTRVGWQGRGCAIGD
ncbi:MAG TPA: glutaredoxin domain-containing protein [Gemmatimonadales bacterium]|jgi:glutaredoxin 3|nr:glutaredoxin domain-containing protein [Gemmatimonadales bacterium]